jgi:hypothetical protein
VLRHLAIQIKALFQSQLQVVGEYPPPHPRDHLLAVSAAVGGSGPFDASFALVAADP